MRLYLFRHGIAINRAHPECPADPERALTEEGIARTRRAAQGLKVLGAAPELVVVSPYVRAVETGRIAAEVLGVKEDLVYADELLPERDPEAFLARLPGLGERDLLCAGHAPNMDVLLAAAVGFEDGSFTAMKKAGAACIELVAPDRLPGELVWLMQPKTLRRLAATVD